jgi:tRNA threonylcarbamoyladenosine biosynthesis protein TsaB
MKEVDAYAVAAGPGSFTGARVGLTTVKAWNEVYGKPIAAVSRLEALAGHAPGGTIIVAACADGRRGQVFGAVYQREAARLTRMGDEIVLAPGKFVEAAVELAKGERIAWAMTNPDPIVNEEVWKSRASLNEPLEPVTGLLTMGIGRIGARQIEAGQVTNALSLDANYLRREDAKSVWKDGPRSGD